MNDTTRISSCGAVNLVGAIFGVDPVNLKAKFNIPVYIPKYRRAICKSCGIIFDKSKSTKGSRYCNSCRETIVICSWCGKAFNKYTPTLLSCFGKKNQDKMFCSRQCLGAYAGRTYGFGVHRQIWKLKKASNYKIPRKLPLHLYYKGYRYKEIAELLGVTIGSINWTIYKHLKLNKMSPEVKY